MPLVHRRTFIAGSFAALGLRRWPLKDDLDAFIEAEMARDTIPGLAAVIIIGGRIVWSHGYGFADIGAGRRMDPATTIQNIGSISKTITGTALMQLVEQNRIDLSEDELRDVMEEYPHGGDPYGLDSSFDNAYELAAAETPEQALYELYLGSGVGRDGDAGLMSLIDFMQATTAARHDIHDWPKDHPDSLLPGSPVAPSCP